MHALASETAPSADVGAAELLLRLQVEQYAHDETYHKEIARLTMQDRLRHLTLHFAKYVGQLVESDNGDEQIKRLVTDTFIIALSCANVLHLKVADELGPARRSSSDLGNLGWHLAEESDTAASDKSAFLSRMAAATGRMAAAGEKLDHLEDYPFRPVYRDGVVEIIRAALEYCSSRGWNLSTLARERLAAVKQKSMFYDLV